MKELKDSGDRRKFETGAVRDRAVGKGLPALISAPLMQNYIQNKLSNDDEHKALAAIYGILISGEWYQAISVFHQLVNIEDFVEAIRRLSLQLEKGAIKYSERNWEKGIPLEEYCNSAIRHILALIDGQDDEDHYAAALFNVMALYHTGYMISIDMLPKELGFGGANASN